MKMAVIDWVLVLAIFVLVLSSAWFARRYMRGVADFLAAGRTAGRYLISVASGIAGLGAITIVANLQMNYEAGFAMSWWGMSMALFMLIAAVTGWVNYRFRATRCLTLAEFFERRYSRSFRLFAGLVAFIAGLINFGIFPSVGAWFFIHYLGLPTHPNVPGASLPVFPLLMLFLLATAVFSVFVGGHVAVIFTDFIQGLFTNVVFIVILLYLWFHVGWGDMTTVLLDQPTGKSLINPFDTSYIPDFNFWYFLIGVAGLFYGAMSWQGTAAYNTSAKSAHEAKMGIVLGNLRGIPQSLFMTVIPIIMMTVYLHPDWAHLHTSAEAAVGAIANPELQSQMRVPIVLSQILPTGLFGAFAAVMLACFITTHNTYLHSWGSIFIQDVVLPFREKPLTPTQHLGLLRWSILGVAAFIFLFSWFYKPTQAILMFFAITGAIFAGGSGAVIIGGLYTRWGTTLAAWVAMITGSTIAVGGILLHHFWATSAWLQSISPDCPLNGQEFWALGMGASAVMYLALSLLKPKSFDLTALLNRGQLDLTEQELARTKEPPLWQRVFAITREFTASDKLIYVISYLWVLGWLVVFIAGTAYNLWYRAAHGDWVPLALWLDFWQAYVWIYLAVSVIILVWFAIGGFSDIKVMFKRLATMQRDAADSGMVRDDPET
ncbi:sodium:solute symporter [bacterium]|nr:sodium:solute symporter [bacterium]